MKNLFALTILRIINLQFESQIGRNPDMISLINSNGNKIYVERKEQSITISVYRVSKRCLLINLKDESQIEDAVVKIKEKVKCVDNL
jgi:TfoX/Sxy family transcriptional regulator of competence genes